MEDGMSCRGHNAFRHRRHRFPEDERRKKRPMPETLIPQGTETAEKESAENVQRYRVFEKKKTPFCVVKKKLDQTSKHDFFGGFSMFFDGLKFFRFFEGA